MIPQTKFWLASASFTVAMVALFIGRCTFQEWAAFIGTLFTLFTTAHVVDTHLQQKKMIPQEQQTS